MSAKNIPGQLAAAAPELLEAAIRVRDNNRKGVTGKEAREAWAALNAAIAKATGATMADAACKRLQKRFVAEDRAVRDAAPDLLSAAQDAEWALEGIIEDEDLGGECPRIAGFDLCGAKCCEHSGCAIERLSRVRAAIAKATGAAS